MKIPVFHDDQHGTAIIVGAAVANGLRVVGKELEEVKLVCSGAGAAALACLDLLVLARHPAREHLGRRHRGRRLHAAAPRRWTTTRRATRRRRRRARSPTSSPAPTSSSGLSAARVLKPEWLAQMATKPLILALANPEPEIMPDVAKAARPDAVIATGRSDFPNQVNNVLCFPFIFRGALDVGATTINEAMKLACVRAIADLAMAEQSDIVANAYGDREPALRSRVPDPEAVRSAPHREDRARGGARRRWTRASRRGRSPTSTRTAQRLTQFVYHSGLLMKPIFDAAKKAPKRIVYAEGEDERVLRAVQVVVDEGLAQPDPRRPAGGDREAHRALRPAHQAGHGLRDRSIPSATTRFRDYWTEYYRLTAAQGRLAGSTRRSRCAGGTR